MSQQFTQSIKKAGTMEHQRSTTCTYYIVTSLVTKVKVDKAPSHPIRSCQSDGESKWVPPMRISSLRTPHKHDY
jgi:hypothetical protein